jgi:hypothetical protein
VLGMAASYLLYAEGMLRIVEGRRLHEVDVG